MRSLFPLAALLLVSMACESEVPPPPKPGETCWPLSVYSEGYGAEYCDVQACVPKERSFSANVASGDGFMCLDSSPCTTPTAPEPYTDALLSYAGDGFRVLLRVSSQLFIDGYSKENFQKHVVEGWVQFVAAPGFDETNASTAIGSPAGQVSILSYEGGLLHLRVTGKGRDTGKSIDTPTYICSGSWTYGTCHKKYCLYDSDDEAVDGAWITAVADITVPVVPIVR
jgi:hypothetical protein